MIIKLELMMQELINTIFYPTACLIFIKVR